MPVPEAIAEMEKALALLEPQLRGAQNNLLLFTEEDDTHRELVAMMQRLQRRADLEHAFKDAGEKLLNDGYPTPITDDISSDVEAALNAKIAEMTSLLKHFKIVNPAAGFKFSEGPTGPK